jgi:hypothetical protein
MIPIPACFFIWKFRGQVHETPGHQLEISGRPGSEVGGGEGTAEEPPPAGRVTDEADYFRFADKRGVRLAWRRGLGKA